MLQTIRALPNRFFEDIPIAPGLLEIAGCRTDTFYVRREAELQTGRPRDLIPEPTAVSAGVCGS
jgi:hypothetical protein